MIFARTRRLGAVAALHLAAVAALQIGGLALGGAASAQVAALGSTATGGTSQVGRTLAAAVSEASSLQMRPQEMANTADYIPLVNAGEIQFGIANVVQFAYAAAGEGMSEGRPHPNLRTAAVLMPFRNAYVVRRDSGIEEIADLAGKRVPTFSAGALGDHVTRGYLANAGLSVDDVQPVDVPNFPRMWAAFAEGSADVAIVVVGAGNAREFDATLGGIRYLSLDASEAAMERLREWLPQAYAQPLDASADIPGLAEPTNVNVFDYILFAAADAPEGMVYEAVKALHAKAEELGASGPVWAGFSADRMSLDVGVDYHPGAVRFYEEAGLWNR